MHVTMEQLHALSKDEKQEYVLEFGLGLSLDTAENDYELRNFWREHPKQSKVSASSLGGLAVEIFTLPVLSDPCSEKSVQEKLNLQTLILVARPRNMVPFQSVLPGLLRLLVNSRFFDAFDTHHDS